MIEGPYIAEAAALIGDPARAIMLSNLIDGRARTAGELAQLGGVTPQTASGHLTRMVEGGLLRVEAQGRHRYYLLADASVARAIEALSVLADQRTRRHRPPGPRDPALRHARTCYDHLAGRVSVALADRLTADGFIAPSGKDYRITASGRQMFAEFGIDLIDIRTPRRHLARQCLDWSERRPHVAGSLGAALLDQFVARRWVRRTEGSRLVVVTTAGTEGLTRTFGITLPDMPVETPARLAV